MYTSEFTSLMKIGGVEAGSVIGMKSLFCGQLPAYNELQLFLLYFISLVNMLKFHLNIED